MMLKHFRGETREVSVIKKSQGMYVRGEWTETEAEPVPVTMLVRSISPERTRHLPEGKYTAEDKRFYKEGAPEYESGDIIIDKDINYEVMDITDRNDEGGFTIYFGKRQYDQS